MKKKVILLSSMLMLGISIVNAQTGATAYAYVKQDGTYVPEDGTAAFNVPDLDNPVVMKFDDSRNAVMTYGTNTVAKLTEAEELIGGVLAADFDNQSGNSTTGSLTVTVGSVGYATLYSPFQLNMPSESGVSVYAPTFENNKLKCNRNTQIDLSSYTIIPVCTSLILKETGSIKFTMSSEASNVNPANALSGTALTWEGNNFPKVAEGYTYYTLGHERTDRTKFGFFKYVGKLDGDLNIVKEFLPAKAYLVAQDLDDYTPDDSDSGSAKYIPLDFSDEATAISSVTVNETANRDGKYIENTKIVIVKNGQKFNIIGQEVK